MRFYLNKVFQISFREFQTSSTRFEIIRPYVQRPWSYAFGKSDKCLIYETIGETLTNRAKSDGKRYAIISQHENLKKTFEQLDEESDHLASGLHQNLGINRGDVVGLWSCNSYNWVLTHYACAKLGAVTCTINPAYKMPEFEYALMKGKVKCLFMPGDGSKQHVVNSFYKLASESSVLLENKANVQHVVHFDGAVTNKTFGKATAVKIEDIIVNKRLDDEIKKAVQVDDPAFIMFTSGTTGKPKGAVLTHSGVINNANLVSKKLHSDKEAIINIPLPLFHCYAAVVGILSTTLLPGTAVLNNYYFDAKHTVEAIKANKCTYIMLTATMIIDIMDYMTKKNIQMDSLKGVMLGAASTPIEVAHHISKCIPSVTDIRIGYGATELSPVTLVQDPSDPLELRMETVGYPLDFLEIKLIDPSSGNLMKIGEKGEICVRGHNVMLGYLDDEEKTKEAIQAGWYKTGDIGTMDENGYVKIVGRTKEMIIRGGENIYPLEVEEVLHQHENVLHAFVVGIPDKRVNEEVCAWIQLVDKSKPTTEKEIRDFCKDKITYFKIPKHVIFVDGFPLTATGKVKKFEMVEKSLEILGIKN